MDAPFSPPTAILPRFVRARGGVSLRFAATGRRTEAMEIAETGGYRVRFPRGAGCEGVLINTGGGMTGGDRFDLAAELGPRARVTLTTQAAEKIYRSQRDDTEAGIRLTLAGGSRLDWLPQEQILFDGARLRRTLDVELAGDAELLLAESVVFGRLAMGETLREGFFHDRWHIRRDGRLVFAEAVSLSGDIDAILARPAVGNGARAAATVLLVAPDAEARLEAARDTLRNAACEAGAGAFDGMLIARFLGPDPREVRSALVHWVETLRGAPVPRSWQT